MTLGYVKGHGTENDFLLIPDADGTIGEPSAELVRALCDRHAGLGADGVIRVVRTDATDDPAAVAARGEARWFMDYRNSDGSLSEMCGNGVRVYARWLQHAGWLPGGPVLRLGTRAGVREVQFDGDDVAGDMGPARLGGDSTATIGSRTFTGTAVDVGNPHLACVTDVALDALDLEAQPGYDAALFPHGVNVEFLTPLRDGAIAMRVHERGVGETLSCGTGTVAAAAAARAHAGEAAALPLTCRVDVQGGSVEVELAEDQAYLTGPAVLVAAGQVTLPEEG